MADRYKLYIDGEFVEASGGEIFTSIDPSTEEPFAEVAWGQLQDIDRAVDAGRQAFEKIWRLVAPKQRSRMLHALSKRIEERADEIAELETLDTGKPLPLSRKEVLGAARYFEYYAGCCDKLHGRTIPLAHDYMDFTLLEPKGVSAQIIPWNMPFSLLSRGVAPALATGNTVVAKPAQITSLSAIKLAELIHELEFPAGVYNVVPGRGSVIGSALAAHGGIDCITFTGSLETGREVMKLASKNITPVLLELGGKSPHIIFEDADLDVAVAEAIKGGYANCGMICSAGSRVLVHASIHEAFVAKLVEKSNEIRVGPGLESPDMGPLISAPQLDTVMGYIEVGRKEARVACGGGRPAHLSRGYFIEPTALTEVDANARVAQEEIFGPVISVLRFADDDEALAIANNSEYGLVSGIFTHDVSRALRFAKELRSGQVFVNEFFAGGEETPFGGYKKSGFGREKGWDGLLHYLQTKNVAIKLR